MKPESNVDPPEPWNEDTRLIKWCLITAGIVSFLGMWGHTGPCFVIFWAVGFCFINEAFKSMKYGLLRGLLNAIAQIAFILLFLWLKSSGWGDRIF